jgi:hypothetical protein
MNNLWSSDIPHRSTCTTCIQFPRSRWSGCLVSNPKGNSTLVPLCLSPLAFRLFRRPSQLLSSIGRSSRSLHLSAFFYRRTAYAPYSITYCIHVDTLSRCHKRVSDPLWNVAAPSPQLTVVWQVWPSKRSWAIPPASFRTSKCLQVSWPRDKSIFVAMDNCRTCAATVLARDGREMITFGAYTNDASKSTVQLTAEKLVVSPEIKGPCAGIPVTCFSRVLPCILRSTQREAQTSECR